MFKRKMCVLAKGIQELRIKRMKKSKKHNHKDPRKKTDIRDIWAQVYFEIPIIEGQETIELMKLRENRFHQIREEKNQ